MNNLDKYKIGDKIEIIGRYMHVDTIVAINQDSIYTTKYVIQEELGRHTMYALDNSVVEFDVYMEVR